MVKEHKLTPTISFLPYAQVAWVRIGMDEALLEYHVHECLRDDLGKPSRVDALRMYLSYFR